MTGTGERDHFYEPTREKRYGRDLLVIQTFQQEVKPSGFTESHQPSLSPDTGQVMTDSGQSLIWTAVR